MRRSVPLPCACLPLARGYATGARTTQCTAIASLPAVPSSQGVCCLRKAWRPPSTRGAAITFGAKACVRAIASASVPTVTGN
jgi:hypothetical protein